MGMAASQARLLMLTSRLHDVELKAQQLQNAKLQLSTQQDAVYEDYQKALDATTLTAHFTNGTTGAQSDVAATFSNLFSLGAAADDEHTSNYILIDSRGRVVVEDEIADAYYEYTRLHSNGTVTFQDNAYQFAYFMLEGQNSGHGAFQDNGGYTPLMTAINEVYAEVTDMSDLEENAIAALQNLGADVSYCPGNAANILTWAQSNYSQGGTDDDREALDKFVNYFWSHYGQKVFTKMGDGQFNCDNEPYQSSAEFDYYVRIFHAIQQHGGCISIEDYNGPDGSAATNNEWLTAMLQSGQMSVEIVNIDNIGNATITGTSVASDDRLAYTATTQIDKVAMAKAEAEYEHEMKVIDRKEQKIDLELKKIETERTAITKEYDSIKKVSDDNIDRTFGIFS